MTKYRVCFTTYGQTFVNADSEEQAEEIAMNLFYDTGKPEFTDDWNDWEMIDQTEEVNDWVWEQRKRSSISP